MTKLPSPKTPPHSLDAERSVIGALMLDNRTWDRIIEIISEVDFYRTENRLIFEAIADLSKHNKPFDVITISEILKEQRKIEEIGGEAYLFELAQNTPSAANIVAYAEIVRDRSIMRQLLETGTDIVDSVFETGGRNTKELMDIAEKRVFQISAQHQRGLGPVKINKLLVATMDHIDKLSKSGNAITGLSTGYIDFDKLTSGFQKGDLIIIAGRPSMGKTTFAMNIAEHAALKEKKSVLVFSMEMPSEQLMMRTLSSLSRVDQNKIRTGRLGDDDWARIASSVGMLSELNVYIDDTPSLSPGEVRSRARRIAREHGGIGLIIVDYLQLMQVPDHKENRTAEISEISRSLKALAKELSVPLIALSQLNRSLEHRTDRRPVMSDLRESGSIEQDADVIAFIYRDEVYNEDSPDKGTAEIIIRKQRNGPIGDFRVTFRGNFNRFDNYASTEVTSGVYRDLPSTSSY